MHINLRNTAPFDRLNRARENILGLTDSTIWYTGALLQWGASGVLISRTLAFEPVQYRRWKDH